MARRNKALRRYPSKYPCHVDPNLKDSEWRKERTLELYSYLPQTSLEDRFKYKDVRDEVIYLNYNYFGFIASHVYIKNVHVSYEDKFQSALTNFCTMWHKFQYAKKYRTDLSFSVFFKPRLSECVYRELLTVKHTVNRSLKMEAAEQLGKHYSDLTYEDLSKVSMTPEKMEALKAVFHADYEEDMDTASIFIPVSGDTSEYEKDLFTDKYDGLDHTVMREMMERERKLTVSDVIELSDMLGVPVADIKAVQPEAEKMLYDQLRDIVTYKSSFTDSF